MSNFFGGEFGDKAAPAAESSLFLSPPIQRGKYSDWRGDLYDVMHVVRDVHEGTWMVLYRSLIDVNQPMMVMNYAKFFGTVDVGAYRRVQRFTHVVDPTHSVTSPTPPKLPRTVPTAPTPATGSPRTGVTDASSPNATANAQSRANVGSNSNRIAGQASSGVTITSGHVAPVAGMAHVEGRVPRRPAPRAPLKGVANTPPQGVQATPVVQVPSTD